MVWQLKALKLCASIWPKSIICGGSTYTKEWDDKRLKEIAAKCGALLLCNMAHITELVATKVVKFHVLSIEVCQVRKYFMDIGGSKSNYTREFHEIEELSLGSSRMRELNYCYEESENYIPCFNISKNLALGFSNDEEYSRHFESDFKQNFLFLTPSSVVGMKLEPGAFEEGFLGSVHCSQRLHSTT